METRAAEAPSPKSFTEAQALFKKGSWQAAETAFLQNAASGVRKYESLYMAALCKEKRNRIKQAEADYAQLIRDEAAYRQSPDSIAECYLRLHAIMCGRKNSASQRSVLLAECARRFPRHAVLGKMCAREAAEWLKAGNAEKAEVHWVDETAVMNSDVRGRSYSPRGTTPTTRAVWGSRQRFSMISSVNNQGKCHWMIIDGVFNADRLIEFMESLVKEVSRKVFLVMDNLKVHHCKPVKESLEKNAERIEAFYLPSYSPELNPDERLNADLKHAITTSVPRRTREGLLKKTKEHMEMVKTSPERVKTYFMDKHVTYAAEST